MKSKHVIILVELVRLEWGGEGGHCLEPGAGIPSLGFLLSSDPRTTYQVQQMAQLDLQTLLT